MIGSCHQEVVQAAEEAAQQEAPFKLRATFQEQGGKLVPESPQRFQAEQAANAYANGKLAEAEGRYREALRLAEANGKLDAESDALLKTNLAAVLRDEKKNAESEKYFGQAIEVARKYLTKRQPVLDYIARHYCALLRREGREFEARIVAQNAKLGFPAMAKRTADDQLNATAMAANADINANNEEQPVIKAPAPAPPKPLETVTYTITITSDGPNPAVEEDWSRNKTHEPPRVSGTFEYYIKSKYNPIHLTLKIPPGTYYWGTGAIVRETYTCPSWKEPVTCWDHIGVPCDFEPLTFTKTYQFHGVWENDWDECSPASDAPFNLGGGGGHYYFRPQ